MRRKWGNKVSVGQSHLTLVEQMARFAEEVLPLL